MKNIVLSLVVVVIAIVGHNPFVDREKKYPVYEPPKTARQGISAADETMASQMPAQPAVSIPAVPRVALYPLLAGPRLIDQGVAAQPDVTATLKRAHHTLSKALGDSAALSLVDRDAQTHPLAGNNASPERAALASSLPADYVLSGNLEQHPYGMQLHLQLSHVQTTRLIASMALPVDSPTSFNTASAVARFTAAIDDHLRQVKEIHDQNNFRLSVAAFLPARNDHKGNHAARGLRDGITEVLTSSKKHRVMAGDHAMALGLEARLARHESASLKPDVIVHGRLLAGEQNGYDLVLFIERVRGLRTTVTLQADTLSSLINEAVAAIDNRLITRIDTVDRKSRESSRQLLRQAWTEVFRNDTPSAPVAGFPSRENDRNRDGIERLIALAREAITKDPQNYQAVGALAMASAATGDRATEYRLLSELMWDHRQAAFDHGVEIMLKHFHRGTTFYISGEVKGLPDAADEQRAINQLLASRLLVPRGGSADSPEYTWASAELLRFSHEKRVVSQYINGSRNPAIDDWARFKLMSHQQPIPTAHPDRSDRVTGSFEASYFYSLANASAPIRLNLGANGFYSAPVDVEITLDNGNSLPAAQTARFLNLIGKSMLADGNNIEADLLYAAMMCEYDSTQCPYSQLIYQDIDNNADNIRRRIVGNKDRNGRKRLVADGLIDMARRERQQYKKTVTTRIGDTVPGHSPKNATSIPPESPHTLQLRDCERCPDYIRAGLISSPDGKWQIERAPYFEGATPIRPELMPKGLRDDQSYTRARAWLFTRGLIDLMGMPTQRRIPADIARAELPKLFPGISDSGIQQFTTGYRKSRERRNVGRVVLYNSSRNKGRQTILAPDGFAAQQFGTHATISNRRLLVCDGHRSIYVYKLQDDEWNFYRKLEDTCVTQNLRTESPVAVNDEWLISYRLDGRIKFHKDDGAKYVHRYTRQINDDFTPAHPRGASIEGIWLNDKTLLVGTASRAGYRLNYYTLQDTGWTASGSIDSANHFSEIRFHNEHAWQLSGEHIIAYHIGNDSVSYDFRLHIPGAADRPGNSGSILFLQQDHSTQLVWASTDSTESIDVH